MKAKFLMIGLVLMFSTHTVLANAKVDTKAPEFKVKDALGKEHSLKDFTGNWVVLEWYNRGCPYVKKHYGSGNMQKIQKTYAGKGVKWLTVISSAPGTQGYLDASEAKEDFQTAGMGSTALLLDEEGTMGKAYGAKTTPHMFVINPKGVLVYAGAIDDNDSSSPDVIAKSKNYVVAALDAGLTGKPIETKSTKPYGCGVKYK
jgi:peroxiredoxin